MGDLGGQGGPGGGNGFGPVLKGGPAGGGNLLAGRPKKFGRGGNENLYPPLGGDPFRLRRPNHKPPLCTFGYPGFLPPPPATPLVPKPCGLTRESLCMILRREARL